MKPTIETINGKKHTVIRKPFDAEWVREQLAMGVPVLTEYVGCRSVINSITERSSGGAEFGCDPVLSGQLCGNEREFEYTVTILPPLPRRPTKDDAWKLHLYAAYRLIPMIDTPVSEEPYFFGHACDGDGNFEIESDEAITHALYNGERVEIAIEERM